MAFYATLTSTIIVLIFGGLKTDYTLNLILMAIIGGSIGIWFQNYLYQKTGRQAYIVFLLDVTIAFSATLIPIMEIPAIIRRSAKGSDILATASYCP